MNTYRCALLTTLLTLTLTTRPALGENVDLSTVPNRDTVQLTIYNSEDLTLVRETRKVSFKPGNNPLQFSWANTLIDPTSVELRFVTHTDSLELLDSTFPHDKPQMLYWNVQSEVDGEAVIEISYFTSGISWTADYVGICTNDESAVAIEGFVRVTNQSGEDYEDAQVRLVVGTINLTEKIAQLAQLPVSQVEESLGKNDLGDLRFKAARELACAPAQAMGGMAGDADAVDEKAIIKEGLSEYFIYTVDGTETIPNGWSKRMRSFESPQVPMKTVYRYRVPEYGDQLVRVYLLVNDQASTLGESPLPDGTVRLFRTNERKGLSFVTAQQIKYVPIGDKIELNLGPDPEVVCDWIKRGVRREQVWMQVNGTSVYRKVDNGKVEIEVDSSVAGWDEVGEYVQRVRNYTARPIQVEIRRTLPGHIAFRSPFGAKLHDYQTVEYTAEVPANKQIDLKCQVIQHCGHSEKQQNVTLEKMDD